MTSLSTLFKQEPFTHRSEAPPPAAVPSPPSRSTPASADTHAQALRSRAVAAAPGAIPPRAASFDTVRWKQELQRWCDADPHRAVSGHHGLFGRLRALGRKARAEKADDGLPLLAERREVAMQRLLACHAQGADGRTLDLSGLGLSSLPPGLERLAHLEALDLSNNTGLQSLPEGLAGCRNLRSLTACNGFVSHVPPSLFQLPNLETLDLSANPFLKALPQAMAQAPRLRELRVPHCDVSHLPPGMADMPALRTVDVSHNRGLHTLPPGLRESHVALALQGTPVALTDRLLQPVPWSPGQRAALETRVGPLSSAWRACAPLLQDASASRAAMDQARNALSQALRIDGAGTEAAWADADAAVQRWLSQGLPITTERIQEIGWRLNGRPAGGAQLRAMEFQRIPADAQGLTGSHLDYPPVRALPGHLAALDTWLAQGDAPASPLAATERATLLYRAVESLRPFEEGNGPAALMAMDWALQQHGLPPVALDAEAMTGQVATDGTVADGALTDAAVFASAPAGGVPHALFDAVVQGMEEALRTLLPR